MKRIVALCFVCLIASSVAAETAKAQKVRQLLKTMNAGEMGMQVIDNMINAMKTSLPQVPEEFWSGFRQKIRAQDLLDMVVPVYEKNLDERDLDELLRFYSSPTGQRFIAKQPIILQESMVIGQRWGEELAQKAIHELQVKGYTPKI